MSVTIQVVQPSNFLSTAATSMFHAEIKSAIDSGAMIVLVDLINVKSLSSSSFIAVVKTLKLARISGCQLFLCSMNEQIRMLFELTGLDQVFKAFADSAEFNQYLQIQSNAVEVPRQAKHEVDLRPVSDLRLAS